MSGRLENFRWAGIILSLYCLGVVSLFHDTSWSIASTWIRSETYAHGFLIVPISLWLIWEKREALSRQQLRPNFAVLLLLFPLGFIWLVASLVDVLVVQQLALVAVLVVGIWAIVGNAVAGVMSFALGFLFLAVPMGEDLVPPMMELTATATVWMIQMTGIPVFREGLFFSLPSGNWSVIEACSGIRYLIASVTLGILYAYMTYRSMARRALFVLASIIVPVIANVLRAYMIVMLGHLSDMKIATGVDHLIYGWVFFGVVMLLLFWVGSWWREDISSGLEDCDTAGQEKFTGREAVPADVRRPVSGVAVAALLVVAIWPGILRFADTASAAIVSTPLLAPPAGKSWTALPANSWDWRPANPGTDREIEQFYSSDHDVVALYVQQFLDQSQGVEMVTTSARFINAQPPWKVSAENEVELPLGNERVTVDEVVIGGPEREIVVWFWYRIGGLYTANRYLAKLAEVAQKISLGEPGSSRIVLATTLQDDGSHRALLQRFIADHMDALESALDGSEVVVQ